MNNLQLFPICTDLLVKIIRQVEELENLHLAEVIRLGDGPYITEDGNYSEWNILTGSQIIVDLEFANVQYSDENENQFALINFQGGVICVCSLDQG